MKRRVVAVMLAVYCLVGLTGCIGDKDADPLLSESKKYLVEYIRTLESEGESSGARIVELEKMLKGIQETDVKNSGIKAFGDGTGRLTLTSKDGVVDLPVPFEYPGSIQAYNASGVNIIDNISIKPSSNWVVKLEGTEVIVEHSTGISGTITIGTIDRTQPVVKTEQLADTMNKFFESMPPEKITYTRLYLGTIWAGSDATSHTFINEKDAMIRCGMINNNINCITYMFSYSGAQDTSKDEIILTLLQTLKIDSQNLRVE